jgi:hypothetical protein
MLPPVTPVTTVDTIERRNITTEVSGTNSWQLS